MQPWSVGKVDKRYKDIDSRVLYISFFFQFCSQYKYIICIDCIDIYIYIYYIYIYIVVSSQVSLSHEAVFRDARILHI